MHSASAEYSICTCIVCTYIRVSITLRYCVKMVEHIVEILTEFW